MNENSIDYISRFNDLAQELSATDTARREPPFDAGALGNGQPIRDLSWGAPDYTSYENTLNSSCLGQRRCTICNAHRNPRGPVLPARMFVDPSWALDYDTKRCFIMQYLMFVVMSQRVTAFYRHLWWQIRMYSKFGNRLITTVWMYRTVTKPPQWRHVTAALYRSLGGFTYIDQSWNNRLVYYLVKTNHTMHYSAEENKP